jgi:hypothetical protein
VVIYNHIIRRKGLTMQDLTRLFLEIDSSEKRGAAGGAGLVNKSKAVYNNLYFKFKTAATAFVTMEGFP